MSGKNNKQLLFLPFGLPIPRHAGGTLYSGWIQPVGVTSGARAFEGSTGKSWLFPYLLVTGGHYSGTTSPTDRGKEPA